MQDQPARPVDGNERPQPGAGAAGQFRHWGLGQLAMTLLAGLVFFSALGKPLFAGKVPADAIEQALRQRLAAVDARSGFDIRVHNGIVVLSGSVENLLQKNRARRIAESIRGVRSVVDLITVHPARRADDAIGRDVGQALIDNPVLGRYDISVAVTGGVVTLEGTVDAWILRRLARQAAMAVRGVSEVHNRIDVKTRLRRSDDAIRQLVQRRLAADLYVDASQIKVRVQNSEVALAGVVGTAAEKRRAAESAWIPGVGAVDARALLVDLGKKDRMRRTRGFVALPDTAIREAVTEALALDPRVSAYSIDVAVADGRVTLIGVVDTLYEKKIAAMDVLNTTGVWRVENRLTLRYRAFPADDEVESQIVSVFQRDAELHALNIRVSVDDLRCRLSGTVATVGQKIRAENVAAQVGGVLSLENELRVQPKAVHQPGDSDMAARISDELYWSPFVDSDRIRVTVTDARAVLKGSAAGLFAAHSAVQNAFEGGAKSVRTELALDTGKRLDAFFKRDNYTFQFGRIFREDP